MLDGSKIVCADLGKCSLSSGWFGQLTERHESLAINKAGQACLRRSPDQASSKTPPTRQPAPTDLRPQGRLLPCISQSLKQVRHDLMPHHLHNSLGF